ncbi:hypothetical protein HX109_10930 [Galbibacter sp. BG1]|uniref:tail fiber protein n=1 Tax=Galbibacter sp. BG1 TaxID=1170699 RepID=UPI0015BB081A|nr:tail fiber protein [Galbibacter sp. BG1]QLE02042.1 hypothetical protein HX109_10930 [Galbibacter sp. BG1]
MIRLTVAISIFSLFTVSAQTNNFPDNGDALLETSPTEIPGTITNSSGLVFRSSGHATDGRSRFQYWKIFGKGRSPWGSGDLVFSSNTDGSGNVELLRLSNTGNLGIGTANPNSRLTVFGETGIELRKTGSPEQFMQIRPMVDVETLNPGGSKAAAQITNLNLQHLVLDIKANDSQDSFAIRTDSNLDGEVDHIAMTVKPSGRVGIGTTNPDSELTVKGKIHAQEVKLDLAGAVAPDYVFKEEYNLKSLEEVERHINEKGHLPNIPSAKEMEEEGVHLKEMNLKLLEKIEELTLYVIEQKKLLSKCITRLEAQEQEIALLLKKKK